MIHDFSTSSTALAALIHCIIRSHRRWHKGHANHHAVKHAGDATELPARKGLKIYRRGVK
jgi:hypothetical protein